MKLTLKEDTRTRIPYTSSYTRFISRHMKNNFLPRKTVEISTGHISLFVTNKQPRANTILYIVNVAETISIIQSLNMPLYVAIIKALWDRLSEVSTALSTTTVSNAL